LIRRKIFVNLNIFWSYQGNITFTRRLIVYVSHLYNLFYAALLDPRHAIMRGLLMGPIYLSVFWVIRVDGSRKGLLTIDCSNSMQLCYISISHSKTFYSHSLSSPTIPFRCLFFSSSQFLILYENIRNIWWFFIQAKCRKMFLEPFLGLQKTSEK
jgi:hypothetical protein